MSGYADKPGMKGCRPLTNEEVAKAIQALEKSSKPERNAALFVLGIRSGFRISELLSLKIGDVVQHGGVVSRVEVARKNMKGKGEGRQVALHEEAKAAIKFLISSLDEPGRGDYLFQSQKGVGRPLSRKTAWEILKQAYAAAGLTGKLATHSMRKTFAQRVYHKLGKDLIKTQRAMGHKSVTSTASYLSFSEQEIDDAILKD